MRNIGLRKSELIVRTNKLIKHIYRSSSGTKIWVPQTIGNSHFIHAKERHIYIGQVQEKENKNAVWQYFKIRLRKKDFGRGNQLSATRPTIL